MYKQFCNLLDGFDIKLTIKKRDRSTQTARTIKDIEKWGEEVPEPIFPFKTLMSVKFPCHHYKKDVCITKPGRVRFIKLLHTGPGGFQDAPAIMGESLNNPKKRGKKGKKGKKKGKGKK